MSYMQFQQKCGDCLKTWNAAFGIVGMAQIASPPDKCPHCGSENINKIADGWASKLPSPTPPTETQPVNCLSDPEFMRPFHIQAAETLPDDANVDFKDAARYYAARSYAAIKLLQMAYIKVAAPTERVETSPKWETFCDSSYYDMWAVRPVGENLWGHCFHLPSKDEALGLMRLLNGFTAEKVETTTLLGHKREEWIEHVNGLFDIAIPGEDIPEAALLYGWQGKPTDEDIKWAKEQIAAIAPSPAPAIEKCDYVWLTPDRHVCDRLKCHSGPHRCEACGTAVVAEATQ